mgnify:CR=1 FL=1
MPKSNKEYDKLIKKIDDILKRNSIIESRYKEILKEQQIPEEQRIVLDTLVNVETKTEIQITVTCLFI